MNKIEITEKAQEIFTKALELFDLPPQTLNVEFHEKKTTAGLAWRYNGNFPRRVSFHTILAARAGKDFEDTIIHEIAHLITWLKYPNAKQNHGPEFKSVAKILGGSAKTYHAYDVSGLVISKSKVKYLWKCVPCEKKYLITKALHDKLDSGKSTAKCVSCKSTQLSFVDLVSV